MRNLKKLAKEHSDHGVDNALVDDFNYSVNVMFNDSGLSGTMGEYALPGPLKYGSISEILSHAAKEERDIGIKNNLFKAADGGLGIAVYGQYGDKYWCYIPLSKSDGIIDHFIEYEGQKRTAFLLIG